MPSCTLEKPKDATKAGYVPLASSVLRCLGDTELDLFFWNTVNDRPVLFRDGSSPIDPGRIDDLLQKCGDYLYIRSGDFEDACQCVLASLESIMADEAIAPQGRFELMQTALSFEVEKTLKTIDPGEYIELVDRVGGQIRNLVGGNNVLPSDLFAIARHDSHTFSHVTNVAGYAVVLAEAIGISDPLELDEIAVGAMLHDMGKRFIPNSVLTKASRLDDQERVAIQEHPLLGYEDLAQREDVTHAQRMMVYQHHEHIDGGGYPVRVLGDEIHPWAKLLSIVDVFDALTGRRPYRKPMRRSEATQFIAERAGTQFDKEMARCWVSVINKG